MRTDRAGRPSGEERGPASWEQDMTLQQVLSHRIATSIAIAALLMLANAPRASAVTIYQYTGNPFTVTPEPFASGDRVTGSLTLAQPLAPNVDLLDVNDALDWTFSAGPVTWNKNDAPGSWATAPEPSFVSLSALGLAGLAIAGRRRKDA